MIPVFRNRRCACRCAYAYKRFVKHGKTDIAISSSTQRLAAEPESGTWRHRMFQTNPIAPPSKPQEKPAPQREAPPAKPQRKLNPFNPEWPKTRPTPEPKARARP